MAAGRAAGRAVAGLWRAASASRASGAAGAAGARLTTDRSGPPRVVFLGPPGVGKGTYAGRVAAKLGVEHVAAGDLVRAEVAAGTALGERVRGMVAAGWLLPDGLVAELVARRLEGAAGFVLDGFPRTRAQAEVAAADLRVQLALNLRMREEALVMKCLGRRECPDCGRGFNVADVFVPAAGGLPEVRMPPLPAPAQCEATGAPCREGTRADDVPEVVQERLRVHRAESAAVEAFYRERGLLLDFEITAGIPETWPGLAGTVEGALGLPPGARAAA